MNESGGQGYLIIKSLWFRSERWEGVLLYLVIVNTIINSACMGGGGAAGCCFFETKEFFVELYGLQPHSEFIPITNISCYAFELKLEIRKYAWISL